MGLPVNDLNSLFQLQAANGIAAVQTTTLPTVINNAVHTEDIAWAYFTVANTAAKSGSTKLAVVDDRLITLSEITFGNVYGVLNYNASGAGTLGADSLFNDFSNNRRIGSKPTIGCCEAPVF